MRLGCVRCGLAPKIVLLWLCREIVSMRLGYIQCGLAIFNAAWLRSMRLGYIQCGLAAFDAAWLYSMRLGSIFNAAWLRSMRLGSENRFDAALPPDVRRGYASPVGFILELGLRPWFGLGPSV